MDMASADTFRTLARSMPQGNAVHGEVRLLSANDVAAPAFVVAWERLVATAAEPNPFFEPWFLLPALRQWGGTRRVVTKAWFVDGKLAGLFPIIRKADLYDPGLVKIALNGSFC